VKTYEVLEKALGLIEDEKNWCGQGWGSLGQRCAVHAIGTALGINSNDVTLVRCGAYRALAYLAGEAPYNFNDSHTHAEVVALFQEAIRNEKAEEGIEIPVVSTEAAEPLAAGVDRG
jgi:hypothetical protein